jgi:hypothetical protein
VPVGFERVAPAGMVPTGKGEEVGEGSPDQSASSSLLVCSGGSSGSSFLTSLFSSFLAGRSLRGGLLVE